jgi:hypothetical protein
MRLPEPKKACFTIRMAGSPFGKQIHQFECCHIGRFGIPNQQGFPAAGNFVVADAPPSLGFQAKLPPRAWK